MKRFIVLSESYYKSNSCVYKLTIIIFNWIVETQNKRTAININKHLSYQI